MAQEGGESIFLDADGLCKMPIETPSQRWGWLFEYLPEENAGSSVASLWHPSSACAVCPTGHNSNSSQVRFDCGGHYFGDIELPEPLERGRTVALYLSLNPRGMEIYALDEPTPDDNEDLFPSSELEV